MVDPNKKRLESCKDTVVVSTARKYVGKAKNFRSYCMAVRIGAFIIGTKVRMVRICISIRLDWLLEGWFLKS